MADNDAAAAGRGGDDSDDDADNEAEQQRKIEAKRVYNRNLSARKRQQAKDDITALAAKAEMHKDRADKQEKINRELLDQVRVLSEANQHLKKRLQVLIAALAGSASAGAFTTRPASTLLGFGGELRGGSLGGDGVNNVRYLQQLAGTTARTSAVGRYHVGGGGGGGGATDQLALGMPPPISGRRQLDKNIDPTQRPLNQQELNFLIRLNEAAKDRNGCLLQPQLRNNNSAGAVVLPPGSRFLDKSNLASTRGLLNQHQLDMLSRLNSARNNDTNHLSGVPNAALMLGHSFTGGGESVRQGISVTPAFTEDPLLAQLLKAAVDQAKRDTTWRSAASPTTIPTDILARRILLNNQSSIAGIGTGGCPQLAATGGHASSSLQGSNQVLSTGADIEARERQLLMLLALLQRKTAEEESSLKPSPM